MSPSLEQPFPCAVEVGMLVAMVRDLQAELLQVSVGPHLMKGSQLCSAEWRDRRA